jgi:putative transposase
MEQLLKEARRRTKVVGAFPDGKSALMLVAARLRHVSATTLGTRKYMNMRLLEEMDTDAAYSVA